MPAAEQNPARRGWWSRFGAVVAITMFVGGIVVGTASADGISDQKQKVEQIADQLDAIQDKIDRLDDQYNAAQDRQDQLTQEIAVQQTKVDEQQAQLDALQVTIARIAVDKYTDAADTALSPVFSDATTYSDAQQRDELNRLSIDNGSGDIDEAAAIATQLGKDKADLEAKQQEAATLITSLDDKKDQAAELEAQYTKQYGEAQAELGDLIQQEQERRAAAAVAKAQEVAAQQEAAARAKAAAAQAAADAAARNASGGGGGSTSTPAPTNNSTPRGGGGDDDTPAKAAITAPAASPSPPPPSSRAGTAIGAAQGQLGVPYRFAAESPGVAFDCSGLTKYAWGVAGVSLPHQSAQQYASTPHVSRDQIQPGDLVFYHSPISHVAIYIGGGALIHAPRTGDVVKVAAVNWGNVIGISRPG
jgi:cell wall-associated NlpC family hydrolase